MKPLDKIRVFILTLELIFVLVFSISIIQNEDKRVPGVCLLLCLAFTIIIIPCYVYLSRLSRTSQDVTVDDLLTVVPFFFSGPCTIIQLINIWTAGDYVQAYSEAEQSAKIFWISVQFISLLLSFVSLGLTSIRMNNDSGSTMRLVSGYISVFANCFLRVLVISILVFISPILGVLFLLVSFIILASFHFSSGDGRHSLFLAFANLMSPTGMFHDICSNSEDSGKMLTLNIPTSELARVKVNESGLVVRMKRFLFISILYTSALFCVYLVSLESWLYAYPDLYPHVSSILLRRVFTYTIIFFILIFVIIAEIVYFLQISKSGKDDSIAPPESPSTPMRVEINLNNENETQRPETTGRLYPVIASAPAPDPPFNPYFQIPQPEHGPAGDTIFTGYKKCANATCVTCVKMIEGQHFRSTVTGQQYNLSANVSCTTERLIYMITCSKCSKQYVGKTEQSLKQRHYGHRREIEQGSSALGQHFSSEGQCGGYQSLQLQVIDVIGPGSGVVDLLSREGYWQHELKTFSPGGINIRDELGGARNKS